MIEAPAYNRMKAATDAWIARLNDYPGWREWNREKISRTLWFDDEFKSVAPREDFIFSPEIDLQHAVVIQYLGLRLTVDSLRSTQYYFRRYPFRGLPVWKDEHLNNICEMYFSRFYEYRERAKKLLGAVNATNPTSKVHVGSFIKRFDKLFEAEIRERHSIHHHERFDDVAIHRVRLTQLMIDGDEVQRRIWGREHRNAYRKESSEWARRAATAADGLDKVTGVIAEGILQRCDFLKLDDEKVQSKWRA